jgi:hypothetical protein
MTKQIREYIKEHGRTAARMKFGNSIDDMPIMIDGCKVGVLKRFNHEQYGCWVWQATVQFNQNEYTFIDFQDQQACLDWARRKLDALVNPQFGKMLKIATQANCSRYGIHKWMRSESWPPVHTLQRITKAISPMCWSPLFDAWSMQVELEQ